LLLDGRHELVGADDRPVSADNGGGGPDGDRRQVRDERRRPEARLSGDGRGVGARVQERVLRVVQRRAAARALLETGVRVQRQPVVGVGDRAAGGRGRPHAVVPGRPVVLRGLPQQDAVPVLLPAPTARPR